MHILFISQYFPPEMGAPSARTYELSRAWVREGHQVTVITGFPHHPTGIIPPEYKQHIFKIEHKDGIKVIRTYVFPTANKGFFKRILSYFSFMVSAVLLGPWKTGKVDVVIATSPQFFVAIAGYLLSHLKRRPFIFEVRDLWPESIVQLGQLKNRLIIRILEFIEVFLYRQARRVVVVADSSVPILKEKGIPEGKIATIKNGVDLQLFRPRTVPGDLKAHLNLTGKFVVSYIGTMGLSHALDKVLESAKLIESDYPEIHFLLIGEGAEKQHLIARQRELGLSNVSFLDQIPKEKLPEYYALSDLVLVTLRKLPLFQCVIPSKIFEIMAMARPILISVDGEAKRLVVEEARAGIFVEPENAEQMRDLIAHLYQHPEIREEMGVNGRKFVEKHFDRNKLAQKYLQVLEEIVAVPG